MVCKACRLKFPGSLNSEILMSLTPQVSGRNLLPMNLIGPDPKSETLPSANEGSLNNCSVPS